MGDTKPRPAWTQGTTTRGGPTPQSTGQNKSRINSTGLPHPSSTPPPRGTTVPFSVHSASDPVTRCHTVHFTPFERYLMGHCHAPPKQVKTTGSLDLFRWIPTRRPTLPRDFSSTRICSIKTRLLHDFGTQSQGAFPCFHPAEGSKALRLRFHYVFRRFADFAVLEPGPILWPFR